MTNNFKEKIVDYLVAWRDNKKHYEQTKTELRVEMVRLAVETGLPQEEAMVMNLSDYFDGWLIANGHMQAYRRRDDRETKDGI
jgi:hypothetical protein